MIAKVIVHARSPELPDALRKIDRALGELKAVGIETNARWLRALAQRPEVADYAVTTRFIESVAGELAVEGLLHVVSKLLQQRHGDLLRQLIILHHEHARRLWLHEVRDKKLGRSERREIQQRGVHV